MHQVVVCRDGNDVNQPLAKSIVDTIACPCAEHAIVFRRYRDRDWRNTYHWLITSGLALHLLAAVKKGESELCLPPNIAERLGALDRASVIRTDELRADFLELNRRFIDLGAAFANWKGFALEPDFCEDVRLRPQMDFDFIVRADDARLFDSVLRDFGYQRTNSTPLEATYEIMPGQPYTLEQVYQSKPQRKVELHFAVDHPSLVTPALHLRAALERRRKVTIQGQSVCVLAPADAFFSHAAHAGRHALEGWVRLGWLHEIDRFVRSHAGDSKLWRSIACAAEGSSTAAVAPAVGILLANQIWSRTLSESLRWAETVLPHSAVQWMNDHGAKLAMADFPGTKLNLLLQREFIAAADWRSVERAALFRRRAVPRVAQAPPDATALQRMRATHFQFRFTCRRILFHSIESARYFVCKWMWTRPAWVTNATPQSCNAPFKADSNSWDG